VLEECLAGVGALEGYIKLGKRGTCENKKKGTKSGGTHRRGLSTIVEDTAKGETVPPEARKKEKKGDNASCGKNVWGKMRDQQKLVGSILHPTGLLEDI